MSVTTHPAPSTLPTPAERKPSRLVRLAHTIVAARTRMYRAAVTDPATGRIDPVREQRVLRMMAFGTGASHSQRTSAARAAQVCGGTQEKREKPCRHPIPLLLRMSRPTRLLPSLARP